MARLRNAPSSFDDLEEGEIREEGEIDFLIKLEETCQERLKKLLSKQDLELKKFKIFKKAHEMEFEVNCKWKFSYFEILKKGFERHMKTQYRNFIAMQIEARNKEKILKENWVEMAKNGKFETSFFETPILDSKFKMERFDYESEMRVLLAKNGPSPNVSNPTNPNFRSQILDESNPNPNFGDQFLDESNTNTNLESKEVLENKDEMECNDTTLYVTNRVTNPSHKPNLNLNPNSPMCITPNPNSKIEKKDEMASNVPNPNFPPITTQNPNLENEVIVAEEHEIVIEENVHANNANSTNEELTNIISNSTPNISNISQINPPIPPNQVVAQPAHMISHNEVNEYATQIASNQNTPPVQERAAPSSSNQNAPPVQLPAASSPSNQNAPPVQLPAASLPSNQNAPPGREFPAEDIDIANELFGMMAPQLLHENPLQNELVMLHKLCELINHKHQQKMTRLKAERNTEMEQVEKTYRQLDAELESEFSEGKLTLKRRYETVLRNDTLAQEFHDIYHNAPLPVPSSGSRPAAPTAARRPATPNSVASSSSSSLAVQRPNPVASSNLAVQTPVSQNQDSDSRLSGKRRVSGRGILRAPAPHMMRAVQTKTTKR